MNNQERTASIVSQAIGDEQATGRQTGVILQGSNSIVYLEVTGKGLARPFRIRYGLSGILPAYVVFEVFDEQFSEFRPTLVHWTKALHYLRETNARHSVKRVLWGDDFRNGYTCAKWDRLTYDDRFRITNIYGDPFIEELPVQVETEA